MREVRRTRRLRTVPVPPICVLDFDGDLFDGLVHDGTAHPAVDWACFHTPMVAVRRLGVRCGVVPRTIGGPFAVLVAEQLVAAGAKVVVGLTSSGRLAPALPLPSLVIATEAVRDEGTSLHYLPAGERVSAPNASLTAALADSLAAVAPVTRGLVWTTDAPYRETRRQVRHWASAGALAVEMQAASLFAFAQARRAAIGVVAMVSNSGDHAGEQFDTGEHAYRVAVLNGIIAGAAHFIRTRRTSPSARKTTR
ncbi:MAG: nucleoside phosphorylase [Burkholderiales bacterium]|nr:nucleoside phosphorylase [Burkholderiales bacterium]